MVVTAPEIESSPQRDATAPMRTDVYRFAVFSVWRGDAALLAQTARSALRAVDDAERALAEADQRDLPEDWTPDCLIEVTVKDDVEAFDSPGDLREWLTPEAIRKFKGVRVAIRGTTIELDLRIVRSPSPQITLPETPAVALQVGTDREPAAGAVEQVLETVAATLSRGGFSFSNEPETGGDAGRLGPVLREQVRQRNRYMAFIYGAVFAFAGVVVPILASVTDGPGTTAALIAGIGVFIGIPLAVWAISVLPDGARVTIRRWADRAIFPAVEIADVQPGRRLISLGARLAPVLAAPAAPDLVQAVFG